MKIVDQKDIVFGGYVHRDFQRDNPTRACTIQRRCCKGGDQRFKTDAMVRDPVCPSGTETNVHRNSSMSSLGTWISMMEDDKKPKVRRDCEWKTVGPRNTSFDTSLLPSHVTPLDDWLSHLPIAFSSSYSPLQQHNAPSPSNGVLNFAEVESLLEPRPIELMVKKVRPPASMSPYS